MYCIQMYFFRVGSWNFQLTHVAVQMDYFYLVYVVWKLIQSLIYLRTVPIDLLHIWWTNLVFGKVAVVAPIDVLPPYAYVIIAYQKIVMYLFECVR